MRMTIGMYLYVCVASMFKMLIGFVVQANSFQGCIRKWGVTCSVV
jgi:hypothetical protein